MKLSVKQLRALILENAQQLLEVEKKKEKEQLDDSVDRQIDKYLSEYEKEAKNIKQEGYNFRSMSRNFFSLMMEAEEDENKEDEDKSGEESGNEELSKLTIEDIDLENFADSVMRLIENYDSLLEIRDTIAKRSMNFLSKNYEPNVANEFKEILETQHDVMLGTSEFDEDADDFPAPPAERAQGGGGGGGTA